jgi:hypothetical protein
MLNIGEALGLNPGTIKKKIKLKLKGRRCSGRHLLCKHEGKLKP